MRSRSARLRALPLCLLLAATPSCKLFTATVNAPGNIASDLAGGRKKTPDPVSPTALQTGVMRFADTFSARISQATQEFAERAGTPEARIQALTWSTGQTTSAYSIATGSNPNLAVLDMLVLVSLGRVVHEEYWVPKVWGDADRPVLDAFTQMETQAWEAASVVLTAEHQDALRAALRQWRDEHPEMGMTAFVRLPVFQDLVAARSAKDEQRQNTLGELLSVDPLSGLEPAVRELEQTRLFAERTVFYLQRAPLLLQAQAELLTMRVLRIGEVRGVLSDSDRISKAAESLAQSAAALPEMLRKEREGLLAGIEQAEGPSRKILVDARATLEAGAQMSTALQDAITKLDAFVGRFDSPEPPAGTQPAPASEPGRPFDVTEYGTSARELDSMLQTLGKELPAVQRAIDEAAARGERAVDHAFLRALELGLALIAAGALTVLLLRRRAPAKPAA